MNFSDIQAKVKQYKKTAITFGTIAVIVIVGLLCGYSPVQVASCAFSGNVQSQACLVITAPDASTVTTVNP